MLSDIELSEVFGREKHEKFSHQDVVGAVDKLKRMRLLVPVDPESKSERRLKVAWAYQLEARNGS